MLASEFGESVCVTASLTMLGYEPTNDAQAPIPVQASVLRARRPWDAIKVFIRQ